MSYLRALAALFQPSLFPRRFIPDHEPTFAQEEEVETMRAEVRRGPAFADKTVDEVFYYRDRRHQETVFIVIKNGESTQVRVKDPVQVPPGIWEVRDVSR